MEGGGDKPNKHINLSTLKDSGAYIYKSMSSKGLNINIIGLNNMSVNNKEMNFNTKIILQKFKLVARNRLLTSFLKKKSKKVKIRNIVRRTKTKRGIINKMRADIQKLQKQKISKVKIPFKNFREGILREIRDTLFGKNIVLEANGNFFTLNANTFGELSTMINDMEIMTEMEGIEDSARSFTIAVRDIVGHINILEVRTPLPDMTEPQFIEEDDDDPVPSLTVTKLKKRNTGGFFKHTHNVKHLDLQRFGVYTVEQIVSADFNDMCLIKALRQGGLNDEKIELLKLSVSCRDIPQRALGKLCDILKIKIILKTTRNTSRKIYGKDYPEEYEIGIIDGHYFFNEKKIPITRYFLNNYETLKDEREANIIQKLENGRHNNGKKYYKRTHNNKYYLSAYKVIKWLSENKDKYLCRIKVYAEIYETIHYDKVQDDFPCLTYDEDTCIRGLDEPDDEHKKKMKFNSQKIFFDFETCFRTIKKVDDEGCEKTIVKHIPYLVCARYYHNKRKEWMTKTYYGEDCGEKLLKSLNDTTMLIAHNCGYDFRFIVKYIFGLNLIEKGTGLMCASCKAINKKGKSVSISIRDSYKMITMPLRDFGKVFSLTQGKEVMPYDIYTERNANRKFVKYEKVMKSQHLQTEEAIKIFRENCDKWNCANVSEEGEEWVNIIQYSYEYCKIDCEVLQKGYSTFGKWIKDAFNIDIYDVITVSSLAHKFLNGKGVYEGVAQLSGVPRAFIQKTLVGGRCMTRENKKYHLKGKICDYDAVSLYPSAMVRLGGYLKGVPKVIPDANLHYGFLKRCDGYFVKIKITKIGKHLPFPLMSYINDKGVRTFTNRCGEYFVDKIQLEDWIEYHHIDFKVIQGYYYDDGRQMKLAPTMEYCFNQRMKLKNEIQIKDGLLKKFTTAEIKNGTAKQYADDLKEKGIEFKKGNDAQLIFKLIMNSAYGRSIMKAHKVEATIVDSEEDMRKFVALNFNMIKEFYKIAGCDKWKIKSYQPISEHFTYNVAGTEVLSMSKRIMNEVMAVADNNNIDIYYQDTDSLHINFEDLEKLKTLYNTKYNRVLDGDDMGQFNNDFSIKGCNEPYSEECIILGKKCYLDKIVGWDKNLVKQIEYHLRMKGVPNKTIYHSADKYYKGSVIDLYTDLLAGVSVDFDLLCRDNDGISHRTQFVFNKDYTIHTSQKFNRTLCF